METDPARIADWTAILADHGCPSAALALRCAIERGMDAEMVVNAYVLRQNIGCILAARDVPILHQFDAVIAEVEERHE